MIITINVPLFKKLRDIILFWWDNHFMSHFEESQLHQAFSPARNRLTRWPIQLRARGR